MSDAVRIFIDAFGAFNATQESPAAANTLRSSPDFLAIAGLAQRLRRHGHKSARRAMEPPA
jgi:hypothetical protein